MCDSGKGETFCERSKKRRSARKISRYARNDGMVYIALCVITEKGKPFAKGARKNKVQGRFLAASLMMVWGDGFISRSVQRICLESASCIVIPSEAEGSFLHTGIASYVRQRKRGNLLRRKQESAECKDDFLTAPLMTVGKAVDSMNLRF